VTAGGDEPSALLVDDLRSFVDGRAAHVARTSAAGIEALHRLRSAPSAKFGLDRQQIV
jgi:hypothetical protein